MGKNGVLGIVVPISGHEVMHDIFHGRSVHASLAHEETTELEKGDRIYFYDPENRDLIGEAVIAEIAFELARAVLIAREGKLFLDKADFERYVSSLPDGDNSKMRVLSFKDPTMYANAVRCPIAITDGGTYMTAESFSRIARGNA
jgi:hypothetical protein